MAIFLYLAGVVVERIVPTLRGAHPPDEREREIAQHHHTITCGIAMSGFGHAVAAEAACIG